MQTDEVTYSDINIIKTENGNQKKNNIDEEGSNVVYSQVNVLKKTQANDPPSDSGDISALAKHDPANSSTKSHSEKESRACLSLRCTVLLLSVCVLLLAIAVTMGGLYIVNEEKYSETERMLSDHKSKNDNLTKEITKLMTELQGVRKCADNWEYHDGSCYYFSSDKKNWADSRDACVTMGGHLVIIKSAAEREFLKDKIDNRYTSWIGLTRDPPEGSSWDWLDKTPLTNPIFWGEGQPNDSKGDDPVNGEDCVMIQRGEYHDIACSFQLFGICESKSCSA